MASKDGRRGSARGVCEKVFADALDGHPLISNNSIWRQFPLVRNARWSHGKYVLIGDAAAHRAFFHRLGHAAGDGRRHRARQGAGRARGDVPAALASYEAARRPILEKLVAGANGSAQWYEHFAEHMQLQPADFAMSYITRSGRVDLERLRKLSPKFVARYEKEKR